jgi:hypothetical protein
MNKKVDKNKKILQPIYTYDELLKPGRKNVVVPGFDFDVDQFENVIDCFVPYESVPVILRTNVGYLDQFCQIVYGMPFKETYALLNGISDMFMRKAITNLSKCGNSTALNIASKHFMNLDDEAKKDAINITIVNDLKEDD